MARRRPKSKRAEPVQEKKKPDNVIRIPKVKERGLPTPPCRFHKNKAKYNRKKKHKGRRND